MHEDIPTLIVTHDGRQHADEIAACWFFKAMLGEVRILRTSDPQALLHADILLDVGGCYDPKRGRFDHHGRAVVPPPPKDRICGYATAGLVWRKYGAKVCEAVMNASWEGPWKSFAREADIEDVETSYRMAASRIDAELVAPIDAWDLGIYPPRELSKAVLPFQWILPHLEFDTAVEALGRAFTQRIRILCETVAEGRELEANLRDNGPHRFYLFGDWLIVRAAAHSRVEMSSARMFASGSMNQPLLAVISSIRGGTKWGAFFQMPLPDKIYIPAGFEPAAGRRTVFHQDSEKLLRFVRGVADQLAPPVTHH